MTKPTKQFWWGMLIGAMINSLFSYYLYHVQITKLLETMEKLMTTR